MGSCPLHKRTWPTKETDGEVGGRADGLVSELETGERTFSAKVRPSCRGVGMPHFRGRAADWHVGMTLHYM